MSTNRSSDHHPGAPADAPLDGEHSPLLLGPDEAVGVILLSAPPVAGPSVALLLCDGEHRLVITVVVDGATAVEVARCLDLVAGVAVSGRVAGAVVGIVRRRDGRLGRRQSASLAGLVARCAGAGVTLLDLLVVWPGGWRSVRHLAAPGGGREDGER